MIKLENAGLRAPRKMSLGCGLHSQKRIRAPVSKMIGFRAPQQKFQGSRDPPLWYPDILQWFTQPNQYRDNTHCLNHKSYLHFTHKRDFYTHEQTCTWVYLKASLVPTKHKPIPFSAYSPIPKCICFLSSNLTRLQVTKFLRNISLRSPLPAVFFCRSQVTGYRSQVTGHK